MVNRVMFQKLLKLRRQIRGRPKQLIHVHKTPNRIIMDGYKEHAAGGLLYRELTQGGIRLNHADMTWLDRNFPKKPAIKAEQVLNLVNESISELPVNMNTNIVDQRYLKVKMFFSEAWNCIFFVEYLPLVKLLKVSITYGDKQRALTVAGYTGEEFEYQTNTIRWKEKIFIADVENTPSG